MTDITWGPEIAVDGKRPAWLEDETIMQWSWDAEGDTFFGKGLAASKYFMPGDGDYILRIRLPADHPHYASTTAQAPDLTARMEALVRRMKDRVMSLTGVPSEVIGDYMDARAIDALLPEPVDADLVEARKLAHAAKSPHDPSDFLSGGLDGQLAVKWRLEAIRRGRALEKGETA